MKYTWIDSFCRTLAGTVYDYKEEWQAGRYMVGGKMYVLMGTHPDGRSIISLKCDPAEALHLRDMFHDIIPGYHMSKLHWNSVYLDGVIPDDLMERMITSSYRLVLSGLSKKAQQEFL